MQSTLRFVGRSCLLTAGLLVGCVRVVAEVPEIPIVQAQEAGMSASRLDQIDRIVAEGIESGQMPGCVVAIGHRGKIAMFRAYGHRQTEPTRVPMTTDTLFDLASLTKPIATATSVVILADRGTIHLDDPVGKHLPDFAVAGKEKISIQQLLTHQGGLIADNALGDYDDGAEKAWERVCALQPTYEPGTRFIYSDVGFIVLGELVRRVSGEDLHAFSRRHIFAPLGMTETGFVPADPLRRRAAATERRDGRWMVGQVHDPRAYRLGGIAGHAGLFATARDLAVYAQMMLGRGQYAGVRVLDRRRVAELIRPRNVSGGRRALGWDVETGYSSNRGGSFSNAAFGHGGFTGTAIWIDPELDLFVIFLSSRLHPDGKGAVNRIAGRIGTVAADAVENEPHAAVLPGIDVLARDGFRPLKGRRVGLITNQTGIGANGTSTIRLLHEAREVNLVALFSPEHGLAGKLDVPNIEDGRDEQTRLPVYSLYGKQRKPAAEPLDTIDALVFDIQDVGTRFYTYISTMGLAMQAAGERDVRFVVLDRPNPINGVDTAGPVLDTGRESFTGFHRIPVRHGMTVGELARLFKAELKLDVELVVVPIERWRRDTFFDATGLKWVNPSPNMRCLTQAVLYPGIGLLETTNLSVGRGTDTPFEVIGAPWIDGLRLARVLNDCGLAGVRFVPIDFTPASSKFAGERCSGVHMIVVDRASFRPVRTGLEIARWLRVLYPDDWSAASYDRLLADRAVLAAVLAGKPVAEIEALFQAELNEFRRRREPFLLYR